MESSGATSSLPPLRGSPLSLAPNVQGFLDLSGSLSVGRAFSSEVAFDVRLAVFACTFDHELVLQAASRRLPP